MRVLYDFSLLLYRLGIGLASAWNPKARLWLQGRKQQKEKLLHAKSKLDGQVIWMHCASLGEFEQGRPLLEALHKKYPESRIVLSFFSPSGYEIRKDYPLANLVCYLPLDSPRHARDFIRQINPALAIFVKYEFWHHYLKELKNQKIPTLLVSAIFRPSQPFFKPWGGFWRKMLGSYAGIFVQDDPSANLLKNAGFADKTIVSGDTRFDRVLDVAGQWTDIPEISAFCRGHRVLVAGSTWPEDEEVIAHYAKNRKDMRFIIAPHEIHPAHLQEIEKKYSSCLRFSRLREEPEILQKQAFHVLLIDNMGMLSRLYAYADITYVGGGFGGAGIHNILEAAVYGKPVIFGPVFEKSREARDLTAKEGAFSVQSAVEFEQLMDELYGNPQILDDAGRICSAYVAGEAGATARILDYIQENRLLMS